MRLLHTADWHLGRAFHGASLIDHQAAFLDWLVELADEERVDGVLVAGDLYDRALPAADAVALAGEALQRLADHGRQAVVIPGNHDSALRLGFASALLSRAGLHFRTDPRQIAGPVLMGDTAIYGIPYLEPELVGGALDVRDPAASSVAPPASSVAPPGQPRSHEGVLTAAMDLVRTDLAQRPPGTACVVVAHAFVAGATPVDSERELAVGGAAQVGSGLFAGADYVALGHLHRPQAVAGGRYAGSPLAYSFSEAADMKSVTVIDIDGPAAIRSTTVRCPVPRPLARLRGTLDELLMDPLLTAHEEAWVEATLTDPARPVDGMARLQRRFPHAVCMAFEPAGGADADERSYAARLRGLSEEEVLSRFVLDVRGSEASDEELALLRDALDAGRSRQVGDLAKHRT